MLPKLNAERTAYAVTTNINGTLGFTAGRPLVMPAGTRFQIIRSTNSANAAVGTVIYDGTDLRVNLVCPASRHWYWIRSYVGSQQFSPFQPNTFGVLGDPLGFTTTQINSFAATEIESVEDDSVSLINGGGVVLSESLSAVGIAYLLQVTATFDVWKTSVGGTPEFYIDVNGNATQLGVSPSAFPTATASPGQRITLQAQVPIVPANEVTLSAAVVWTGAQPSGTAEVRNAALRCEKIKR